MSLKNLIEHIRKNNNFLITTHINPEGDALGAVLALYRLLKTMGKRATIITQDNIPCEYNFLPGINGIMKFRSNIKNIKFDCFVILDCSDLNRCGEVYKLNTEHKPVLNIDHHISNKVFGDVNWIEAQVSSCSEMVYKLYKRLRIPLNRDIALLLYTGILTDTGSFRYSNTKEATHRIAADLTRFNLDPVQIYKNIYENIPFEDMKLLTKILPTMERENQGKVVWFQIKKGLLRDKKTSFDLSEHILSFGRAIKDIEVAVLFKENLRTKDEIRVNFRSQGRVDVNKIAQFFGGGGHKAASACTMRGRIEDVTRTVLAKIKESPR